MVREKRIPPKIDVRSPYFIPTHTNDNCLLVRGGYFLPSAAAAMEDVQGLTGLSKMSPHMVDLSILRIGDFRSNAWRGSLNSLVTERQMENGFIGRNDPTLATYIAGSVLDKLLLVPSGDHPGEWPPVTEVRPDHRYEEVWDSQYPACTFLRPRVADHHSVLPGYRVHQESWQPENERLDARRTEKGYCPRNCELRNQSAT